MLNFLLIASLLTQGVTDSFIDLTQVSQNREVKNSLTRLSPMAIRLRMQSLPDWTTDGERLFYTRTFTDFVEAIDFVNTLVEPAEQLGHHPDITISYNRVSVELTTHDAQGITALDFQLATKISQL
ncbi:4a-hydroxytetrahydrobiopterin dehydratase [Leptolyngbya cf. ectocarpi LEGE 11479]|uniref:4a-hydroxytetrahydrobiopterin dehydratase n=2 Tax=Leptolyngbya ectocarpi TaxID=1202 RepID=A0A928X324_LEPEC|nr:4a-hydroxytetrahydrobiopterin dehydratase [Leptolyngbya cf. ectocarpi LEGE 11479]